MRVSEIIRRAIEIGERKGRITFDELNAICSGSTVEPEDIERIIQALSDAEIWLEED
ncbi:RNA polymerase sigma factor region1.1 domain-containing protein [Bradyrhizobium oligotrophicum S58]